MQCSRQRGSGMSNGGIACIRPVPGHKHIPVSCRARLARQVYLHQVDRCPPSSVLCRGTNLHLSPYAADDDMDDVQASFGKCWAYLRSSWWSSWEQTLLLPAPPFVLPRSAWPEHIILSWYKVSSTWV